MLSQRVKPDQNLDNWIMLIVQYNTQVLSFWLIMRDAISCAGSWANSQSTHRPEQIMQLLKLKLNIL